MTELPRRIGLAGAILLSFNGAVGAGIFALPGTLLADFGTFSPWLFPLVALGSMLIVLPFARSVAAFPESGGPVTYGRVFGPLAGFELGWIYYISRAAAFAANANVLTAYLARWWTGADTGALRALLLIALIALLTLVNVAGVRRSLSVLGGLTVLKALPLLLITITAIVLSFPPPAAVPPPLNALEAGVLVVFYAFIGFENLTVPAGETRDPERALPRAIFVSMTAMTLLYFLVQLAFVSALPAGGADEKAPLIDLGGWVAGPTGIAIITFTVIASLAGNLHGNLAATPRLTYAMGERRELPAWFASVHPRFETPANSIAFMGLLAAALALSGSFVFLAAVSVLSRLFVYAATIAALPYAPGRPRLKAAHYLLGAIGIAVCTWAAAQADAQAWLTLGALAGAGLLLYAAARVVRITRS